MNMPQEDTMADENPMRPIATIDVGTNTALLLISSWNGERLTILHDETRFVRLGEGVDASKMVNESAIGRLIDALSHFKGVIDKWSVDKVVIGATSASRDARNKDEIVARVQEATGFHYGVISGEEEANASFAGVTAGLTDEPEAIISLDIGGGSTEFTLGVRQTAGYEIVEAVSLDMGSVRLKEKFFSQQPPTAGMVEEAIAWIYEKLNTLPDSYRQTTASLIGASGTTKVLALLDMPVDEDGRPAIFEGSMFTQSMLGEISEARVKDRLDALIQMDEEEVLALNPYLLDGRKDVFPAGILILHCVMLYLNKDAVHVNAWGIRHGLAIQHWSRV